MNTLVNETTLETARAFLINAGLNSATIEKMDALGYFDAPAAQKHHLNCPHGLAAHCINVTRLLLKYEVFKDRVSAYRVGMFHDLVKCFNYKPINHDDGSVSYAWRDAPYPGHGVASALICADLGISLTSTERSAIIWHMGAFKMSDEELEQYRTATMAHPQAVLGTHFCDHMASVIETLDENCKRREKERDNSSKK